jgi:integrase
MSRKVQNAVMDSRTARDRLKARAKPYYVALVAGELHLGYRRRHKGRGSQGNWLTRKYLGRDSTTGVGRYREQDIGFADDHLDADGKTIFSYAQAYDIAMKRRSGNELADGPLTVKAALDLYFEYLEHQGKRLGYTAARANLHIVPALGMELVDKLDAKTLRNWLSNVSKSAVGGRGRKDMVPQGDEAIRRRRSTANRVLTILKAALNHAFKESLVISDKEWRRVEPFKNVHTSRSRILTVEEARRLINACDPAFRKLVQAALNTGARYGELTRLKVVDYNTDSGTLGIWQSKSGKSRDVYLTEEGIALFKQLTAGRDGTEIMLCKADGSTWGVGHQTVPMKEAVERAKISPKITFHGLRHTYASLAIMSHASLLAVAGNLGHTDTRMIEKHYGHLTQSFRKAEIQKAAPVFGFVADKKVVALGTAAAAVSKGRRGKG